MKPVGSGGMGTRHGAEMKGEERGERRGERRVRCSSGYEAQHSYHPLPAVALGAQIHRAR